MGLFDYIMVFLALASLGLLFHEVPAYKRRCHDPVSKPFARGRLIRRTVGVVFLICAVFFVMAGNYIEKLPQAGYYPLVLWLLCLLCAIGVFGVLIIDVKETAREIIVMQEKMLEDSFEQSSKEND